jgi:hypothetical protein
MRHVPPLKYCSICICLLFAALPQVKGQIGQASNQIKARRLAAYKGETLTGWGTYDYLIGTYHKEHSQAIKVFLESLDIRFRLPKRLTHLNKTTLFHKQGRMTGTLTRAPRGLSLASERPGENRVYFRLAA